MNRAQLPPPLTAGPERPPARRPGPPAGWAPARTLGWIAVTSGVLWVRDTTRSLGISGRVLGLGGGLALAALVAGSLLLASVMPVLPADLTPEARESLRAVSAALLWTVGGLVTAVLLLFAPRRTALSDVLALLPVNRTVTALGASLPVLAVALLVTAALGAPSVVLLATAGAGLAVTVPAAALQAAGLLPLVALLFNAVVPGLQRLRVPPHHALVGGGVAVMAVAVAPAALELGGAGVGWLPHRALAAGAGGRTWALLLLGVWCLAGVGAYVLLAGRLPRDPRVTPSRLFTRLGLPPGRPAALAWYEVMALVRAPQYAAVVVFSLVGLAGVVVGWWLTGSALLSLLAAPALLPFFLASLQSYGHTRASHWLGAHLLARPAPWVIPKALVCLGLALALAVPAAAVASAVGLLAWRDLPLLLAQALPAWAAAMLAGLLLPYSTEQPLSVGLSMGLAGLCYAGGLWAVGRLLPGAPVAGLLGLSLLLLALYLLVAGSTRPELRNG